MKEIIDIFNELIKETSIIRKKEILLKHKENNVFIECIKFLLDSSIVTGINKAKINKKISDTYDDNPITDFYTCINYLKNHNTGTDKDIFYIQSFINSLSEDIANFYKGLITKSIKIGCDTKIVNSVYPNLIDTWEVQLGSVYEKLKLKNNELFYLSQKMNGNRCSYIDGKLISRQGKEFKGLNHILKDIKALNIDNFFLDGELIRKNVDNISDGENFRIGTGIINSDDANKSCIEFVLFDIVGKEEFLSKNFTTLYSDRKKKLLKIKQDIKNNNICSINVVNMLYEGTDISEIKNMLQYAVDNDWEGCMLNKNSVYECKRTTNLIKIKKFNTIDLKVVECLEGEGRLSNTLGALVVEYKNNKVNVGTGYNDSIRDKIWKCKDEIIGKIIEIKYKEITKDKNTGLCSLQFPVFVGIREDKTEESYN